MKVIVVTLDERSVLPTRAHSTDLGLDLYAVDEWFSIGPHETVAIPTGIGIDFMAMAAESGTVFGGLIKDRSSMASKGVFTVGGVIDPEYQGEIKVLLYNSTKEDIMINPGQKIAQMVLCPSHIFDIDDRDKFSTSTERGTKGFGSSGQ
jgi:dUTP pyrophosphatase